MTRRDNIELSLLAALLLFFCIACGTAGTPWSSSRAREIGDFGAPVTAKYDCVGLGWGDLRCAPFRRTEDPDFQYVRLLFSYAYACPVSSEDMTMVQVNTRYTCRWRAPR